MDRNACITIFLVLVAAYQTMAGDEWRLDRRYEQWTMEGSFILGTPDTCERPDTPDHGRWVCSYGMGENGRSLCIVDCQKGYIIEGKPTIFNCNNGVWQNFPIAFGFIDLPYGRCVSFEKKSIEDHASWK